MALWHDALDLQMDTHRWYLTDLGRDHCDNFFSDTASVKGLTPEQAEFILHEFYVELLESLWRGDTVAIEPDIHPLVFKAAEDYDGPLKMPFQEMLCPMGFVYIPSGIVGEDSRGYSCTCNAISWRQSPHTEGLTYLYLFTDTLDPRDHASVELRKEATKEGISIPRLEMHHFFPIYNEKPAGPDSFNVKGGFMVLAVVKYWIALQWLAQQRVGAVQKQKVKPMRASHRRAKKWNPKKDEHYISLITLRRKHAKGKAPISTVNWSHRWVVSGHWRKQYYPSTDSHKFIYIHEYVKGPDELPLIVRERRVYDFAR